MAERVHSIDAARAFFLLLGIPFHFATISIWAMNIHADELLTSPPVMVFAAASHSFRMFAFFVISGYFSAMVIKKRGKEAWLADRIERLGVPFIASLFTVGLVVNIAQRYAKGGRVNGITDLPLDIGYLWFLVVLLMFVLVLYFFVDRIRCEDAVVVRALSLQGWPGIGLIVFLGLWGLGRAALDLLLDRIDIPFSMILSHFVLHAPAFAIGVAAQFSSMKERLFRFVRPSHFMVAAALMAIALYLEAMDRPSLGLSETKTLLEKTISNGIELPVALFASICIFRILDGVVTRQRPWITFFVNGAMAIYLFHMLWTVFVIYALSGIAMHPVLRWVSGSVIVLGLSAISYAIARRNVWLSAAFCGTTLPRMSRRVVTGRLARK